MLAGKALDAVTGQDSGLSVDANVSSGDAKGENSVAQNGNTNVSAGVTQKKEESVAYSGPVEKVVNNEGMGMWELALLVLLAGWAIPSPSEMVKGMLRLFTIGRGRGYTAPKRARSGERLSNDPHRTRTEGQSDVEPSSSHDTNGH